MLTDPSFLKLVFGRLTLDAIPYHEPILVATFAAVALGGIVVFGAITYYRLWGYLWTEWFTSVDHKRIGVMYMVLGIVMLLRGFADAIMMRLQQAIAFGWSARLFARTPLRPDFHRSWRDHDLLRRHAFGDGADELRRAAARSARVTSPSPS